MAEEERSLQEWWLVLTFLDDVQNLHGVNVSGQALCKVLHSHFVHCKWKGYRRLIPSPGQTGEGIKITRRRSVTIVYFVELLRLAGFGRALVVADVSLFLHAAVL